MKKRFKVNSEVFGNLLSPVIIIVGALAITSIMILSIGANPLKAYYHLFVGAFGSKISIINTITKAVPICFAGFAVALSKKAGIFNIGVEGQLIFGAFGSALAGIYLEGLPPIIHIPVALLSGMLFGALYALIPTVLFIKRGVNLLVVFILMNNIVKLLITYFINGPFASSTALIASTEKILPSAQLPYLLTKPTKLSIGILIVIVTAIIIYIFQYKTVYGYELRVCGDNKQAARYSGIPIKLYMSFALLMGGALGGLAGGVEVLGKYHKLYDGFSPGYGFDAIPIALLANGNPIGVILGSFLFGALRSGSVSMQTNAGVSSEIVSVIQGILVTAIACEYIIRFVIKKFSKKTVKEDTV